MALKYLVETLLMPPGHSVVLWLLALVWLLRGRPTGAAVMSIVGMLSVTLFSLPATSGALLRSLQPVPVSIAEVSAWKPEALVVLSGGRKDYAPEYGRTPDTVSAASLQRARFAALLQRRTGRPLLVTGGRVLGEGTAEAELMAAVIRDEFGAEVRWVESRSRTTAENALYSAEVLAGEGIERIALVTSAVHMPRSRTAFEATGLTVLPVPTAFDTGPEAEYTWRDWLPHASALAGSVRALHEMLGMIWYGLRRLV